MSRHYSTKDAQIHQLQRQVEDLKSDKAELAEKCKAFLAESLRYKQRYDSFTSVQTPTTPAKCGYCDGFGKLFDTTNYVTKDCPTCLGSGLPFVEKGDGSTPPRSFLKWP